MYRCRKVQLEEGKMTRKYKPAKPAPKYPPKPPAPPQPDDADLKFVNIAVAVQTNTAAGIIYGDVQQSNINGSVLVGTKVNTDYGLF
jgi:hypothetical protein